MRTKECEFCHNPFEIKSKHPHTRFCSKACMGLARHISTIKKHEEKAKAMGIPVEELRRLVKRGRVCEFRGRGNLLLRWKPKPKTYAQIKAENRKRGVVAGWRGTVVMGGGTVRNWRDPMFEIAEV